MLTPADIAAYHRDGYVVARQVLNRGDIDRLCAEVHAIWERSDAGSLTQNTSFAGVKKMSTIRDPQLHSALFTRYLTDPRLTDRMSQLVGPNV